MKIQSLIVMFSFCCLSSMEARVRINHPSCLASISVSQRKVNHQSLLALSGGGRRRKSRVKRDRVITLIETTSSAVTNDITNEKELLVSVLVLHVATSALLALAGDRILTAIQVVNLIIYSLWKAVLYSKANEEAKEFMSKYFIFCSNLSSNEVPPLSLMLASFSHIDESHIVANMGALAIFGPLALSKLGCFWFAQLYSAGALASKVLTCLWPLYAPEFDLHPDPDIKTLGASGAISAVITFSCLVFGCYTYTMETPGWLKGIVNTETMDVPLGLMGLFWAGRDLFFMFIGHQEERRINYAGHTGGAFLGLGFFVAYSVWVQTYGLLLLPGLRLLQRKFVRPIWQLLRSFMLFFRRRHRRR